MILPRRETSVGLIKHICALITEPQGTGLFLKEDVGNLGPVLGLMTLAPCRSFNSSWGFPVSLLSS